nr:hypothetical protein [Tanacetum cinerariifolium]
MANLSEDIQCASFNTRPPMLDRTDFASWQQRIRLYCQGKENGVKILKSIDEGPCQIGTVRETLAESTEGAPQFGESIHDYYVWFAKLINDMRNIKMTMSRMQLNSKFVNNMLPECGRFVTAIKLKRGLKDSNYDQLYAYLKQHETHAKKNKMMLERFSHNTLDPLALMSNVSNPQLYLPSSSTSSSTQAQENGVAWDAEQLLFLAGGQHNAFDDDVVEQPVQDLALNIREEFRTSSGPSDAGGNPPPVTIHTWLERFNKQKPHSFEKATAPVDAENWISHMEKIFDVMGCEDAFKTRLIVYKFEGNALAWWKAYKQAKGAAGTEEEQAKNFQWGLRRSTLNHLMCMSYTDVAQVANAARNYEILHERDDDDTERLDKWQKSDKRQKSGDRCEPTTQQSSHMNHGHNNDRHGSNRRGGSDNHRSSNNNYSGSNNRNSGYGRDQRNRGQQSNRSTNSGNSS